MYFLFLLYSIAHFINLLKKGYTNLISKIIIGVFILMCITLGVLGIFSKYSKSHFFGIWIWILECVMLTSMIWCLPANLLDPKFHEYYKNKEKKECNKDNKDIEMHQHHHFHKHRNSHVHGEDGITL